MANVNRLGGFRPVKHLTGAPYNGQFNLYEVVVGDGTAINIGDLVKPDAGAATDQYPTVVRVAASGQVTAGPITGSVVGFVVDPTNLNTPQYRAGGTKRMVMVADAPDLIFECADGGTVPCTLALIGMNTGITATAPNTVTGVSPMASGTTAPTTAATLPLKIVGIPKSPDNEAATANQRLHVMINSHTYGSGTGTAGV